jgi:hypothetical protein
MIESPLVRSSDLTRAMNSLSPSTPVQVTDELIKKIIDLHPVSAPEHRIPTTTQMNTLLEPQEKLFDYHLLNRVIKDARLHATPDMTGLRAAHIKTIFRGRRELSSPQMNCRIAIETLIHNIMTNPAKLGDDLFWEYFAGGKLSIILQHEKIRPISQKNFLLKLITSIQGRLYDKDLHKLAGPAHLAGRKDGVLSAAIMTQMELDYAKANPQKTRCILLTDAKSAFQSASRRHCLETLQSDATLNSHLAPFFAKQHLGTQRTIWSEGNRTFSVSSGFTQGDINASKLFACNTSGLVKGLQLAALTDAQDTDNATVMAVIDDITVLGDIDAVCRTEEVRDSLQKPPNYIVNTLKQNAYTVSDNFIQSIQARLPQHTLHHLSDNTGFKISGIPQGGTNYIMEQMQHNLDATKTTIQNILRLERIQDKLLLLLYCIPGRIQHLLSVVPPSISRTYAQQHDDALREAVASTLQLGQLRERDILQFQRKISNHGLGLRSMEENLDFLFLSGFARSIKTIQESFPHFVSITKHTLSAEHNYGIHLQQSLNKLKSILPEHDGLLPASLEQLAEPEFKWDHSKIQRALDTTIVRRHEACYDLTRISDQQAKAAYMAIDATIFMLIPRNKPLEVKNEHLIYLARQLLGKAQRTYLRRYCPNISTNGTLCNTPLDMHDIHVSLCQSTSVRHEKHQELQDWLTDLAKHARIPITPPAQVSLSTDRSRGRADLRLVDVSLNSAERDGVSAVIDVSIVHPAAPSYCAQASKNPHYASKLKEKLKTDRYKIPYLNFDNSNFRPFVVENGGTLGPEAQNVFRTICTIIARESGQSVSAIAHFWKARLLVILAERAYNNAQLWTRAHIARDMPVFEEILSETCYEIETKEQRRLLHSSEIHVTMETINEDEDILA